jgi:hypothetical protein
VVYPLGRPLYPFSHCGSGPINLQSMPMLHGCAFPGCATFTLSTYCIEHELLDRALRESERTQAVHQLEAEGAITLTPVTADDESSQLERLGS